jgi:hypothetical protein
VSHSSATKEDCSDSSVKEGGDDRRTSYAREKLHGKHLAATVGPVKKRRKTGVSTRVPKKPVVIGGESPWRRR